MQETTKLFNFSIPIIIIFVIVVLIIINMMVITRNAMFKPQIVSHEVVQVNHIQSVFTCRQGGHIAVPKQWNGGHFGVPN